VSGAKGEGIGRAAELAREFDRAFAEPARGAAGARDTLEDLLALRAGPDDCLVRLSDIRGLLARPTVVAVPGPVPELLGLTGRRGTLIPVYDLAALQGHPARRTAPAWMILVEADGLVGLAFEELLGHARLDRREIAPLPDSAATAPVPQAARVGGGLRPLLDVPALVATLRRRAGLVGAHKQE
jgi:purine-binding chemotaxis protein CheW